MSVQQLDQLAPKTFEEDGYFNSMLYINYEKYNAMKKKTFVERDGDWACF